MKKFIFFIPFVLYSHNLMHPEDPKERDHNSLGFGVSGDLVVSDGVYYLGQTGSSLNNGSIYIYKQNALGPMDQEILIAPIDEALGFDFGYAIDVKDDLMIIGAPHRANTSGRAFLYQKDGNSQWTLIKSIIPGSEIWTMDFGSEVAIGDDVILIGDRDASNEQGMVYTLYKNSITKEWIDGDPIYYGSINEDGFFGHTISVNKHRALIGSRDGNVAVEYQYNANTHSWNEQHVFKPYNYQSKGRFGYAVKLTGDYAVIGSPGYDQIGYIEIHKFSDGKWEKVKTISNPGDEKESYFGASIAIDGKTVAVGNYNGEKSFIYYTDDFQTFTLKQTLESPWNGTGKFGRAMDLEGNQLLIGATYGQLAFSFIKDGMGVWNQGSSMSSAKRVNSITGQKISCEGGYADKYSCKGLDLYAFIAPDDMGGTELNDIWGWTDPLTGKEIALVGLREGTAFVDVTDPENPFVLGQLPTHTRSSTWRDIKVYKNHAYIVSDNANSHGVQVFDLTNLRGVTEFTTFSETNHYSTVGDVHNIHINEATGFAYAVGIGSAANSELRCGGGSHMIDLSDPANPTFAGCFAHEGTGRSGTGYTHDIQVVVYNGPDEQYKGREIAFSSNETALSIADLTDKSNLKIISKYDGSNFGYVHQGWLTDDQKYFIVNDELNESRGYDDNQTTIIFDVSDLDNPKLLTIYNSGLNTIDHNNYTRGNILFQSNYTAGLRILSIANIKNPMEIAFFDTYPSGDRVAFNGSWSNYPYFESGTIVVTSIEEGLYVLKINEEVDLAIDDNKTIPDNFDLKQNYPNPFNPITQIQYELPKAGEISLTLYNMLGIKVMQLDNGFKSAGIHRISLNGSHLSSGIYFYQLRTEDYVRTRKMSLIK